VLNANCACRLPQGAVFAGSSSSNLEGSLTLAATDGVSGYDVVYLDQDLVVWASP